MKTIEKLDVLFKENRLPSCAYFFIHSKNEYKETMDYFKKNKIPVSKATYRNKSCKCVTIGESYLYFVKSVSK